ncbi:protein O-glucosyltransferase 2-like [Haematobia irritans]|uniref:protein O-glucosyltransferase 2-like n=1 Tax=Haematobia irritans TaxID=7368 RepID=UPI003F50CA68
MKIIVIYLALVATICKASPKIVDPTKTTVYGSGLEPDKVVLPARYFYIHATGEDGRKFKESPPLNFDVQIEGKSPHGSCRSKVDVINRGDGSFVARYTIITDWCDKMVLNIKYNGTHVAKSPYYIRDLVYSDKCYCPRDLNIWMIDNECKAASQEDQIVSDLHSFKRVNFSMIRDNLIKRYNQPESISLCHYVVKDQQIWRKCYGKYDGFKMFMDATLLALGRIVALPDMEFFLNLGDWPLSRKGGQQRTSGPYPIFSWCGSDDSHDIVLPTYDLMESSIENMHRVALDVLSVQREKYPWSNKIEKLFWRGRDSRRERLDLIGLAHKHPDKIDAAITNFFFFRDEENKYGPKVPHISFLEFFKYKYQLNIDGTVASYRLPYLLGGGSAVLKQTSHFYEHFYHKLIPHKHYIPVKRDLSDLIETITWIRENDSKAQEIAKNAQEFVNSHLTPGHIYCYHMALFKEWSNRLVSPVIVLPEMEKLEQTHSCSCKETHTRDEL